MLAKIPSNAYTCKIQVRWKDTDMFGHINNANYVTWLEAARLNWWNDIKQEFPNKRPRGIMANVKIDYKLPVELHDDVLVSMWMDRIGTKSQTAKYVIHNENKEKIYAEASTVIVSFDFDKNRSIPIPEWYKEVLRKFLLKSE